MGRMAYTEDEKKKEKGKMKQRLWNWGQTMEKFNWMEDEVEKLKGLHEMQKKIWEGKETARGQKERERMEKEYETAIRRLRIDMVELLREQARMNSMIERLTLDEKQFVRLRFENGYGFDYISVKMHLSRATLFRIQERVLEKMISFCREDESERDGIETL